MLNKLVLNEWVNQSEWAREVKKGPRLQFEAPEFWGADLAGIRFQLFLNSSLSCSYVLSCLMFFFHTLIKTNNENIPSTSPNTTETNRFLFYTDINQQIFWVPAMYEAPYQQSKVNKSNTVY